MKWKREMKLMENKIAPGKVNKGLFNISLCFPENNWKNHKVMNYQIGNSGEIYTTELSWYNGNIVTESIAVKCLHYIIRPMEKRQVDILEEAPNWDEIKNYL